MGWPNPAKRIIERIGDFVPDFDTLPGVATRLEKFPNGLIYIAVPRFSEWARCRQSGEVNRRR